MEDLTNLMPRLVDAEVVRVAEPQINPFEAAVGIADGATAPAAYESEVFNELFAQRQSLGITDIWRCRASRIDGVLKLSDGSLVGLEVKYRMGWMKACQSNHQMRWFRKHPLAAEWPLQGGVVIFEEFSGDWEGKASSRLLPNGWNHWYTSHCDLDGFTVHLVRYRDHVFSSYFDAYTSAGGATVSAAAPTDDPGSAAYEIVSGPLSLRAKTIALTRLAEDHPGDESVSGYFESLKMQQLLGSTVDNEGFPKNTSFDDEVTEEELEEARKDDERIDEEDE